MPCEHDGNHRHTALMNQAVKCTTPISKTRVSDLGSLPGVVHRCRDTAAAPQVAVSVATKWAVGGSEGLLDDLLASCLPEEVSLAVTVAERNRTIRRSSLAANCVSSRYETALLTGG
jgi:hypothetical protein